VSEPVKTPPTESPSKAKPAATYNLAKAAAIGLGVLIVIALAVMVYGVAAGWTNQGEPMPPAKSAAKNRPIVKLTLAPGVRILSSETQPGRLFLHVRSDTLDEIWVVDTDDGHIVAMVHAEPPKQ